MFSKFCIQIQSEKELKILKVRSDYGGEFENEPFEIFREKHGIIHEFSSPYRIWQEPYFMKTIWQNIFGQKQ